MHDSKLIEIDSTKHSSQLLCDVRREEKQERDGNNQNASKRGGALLRDANSTWTGGADSTANQGWAEYSKYSYSSTILVVLVLVLEGLVLMLVSGDLLFQALDKTRS